MQQLVAFLQGMPAAVRITHLNITAEGRQLRAIMRAALASARAALAGVQTVNLKVSANMAGPGC